MVHQEERPVRVATLPGCPFHGKKRSYNVAEIDQMLYLRKSRFSRFALAAAPMMHASVTLGVRSISLMVLRNAPFR